MKNILAPRLTFGSEGVSCYLVIVVSTIICNKWNLPMPIVNNDNGQDGDIGGGNRKKVTEVT